MDREPTKQNLHWYKGYKNTSHASHKEKKMITGRQKWTGSDQRRKQKQSQHGENNYYKVYLDVNQRNTIYKEMLHITKSQNCHENRDSSQEDKLKLSIGRQISPEI